MSVDRRAVIGLGVLGLSAAATGAYIFMRDHPDMRGLVGETATLTGYAGEEYRRRCLEAGFDTHLVKPADPGEVRQAIHASPVR